MAAVPEAVVAGIPVPVLLGFESVLHVLGSPKTIYLVLASAALAPFAGYGEEGPGLRSHHPHNVCRR